MSTDMDTLAFHFENFNGPMDLLIHLIDKERIDIYDIPIRQLTDQYMDWLQVAESMNLEIASSFLLMAANLVRIKVKMLLPKRASCEQIDNDPRKELVDQIVEYKFIKHVASELEVLEAQEIFKYARRIDVAQQIKTYSKIDIPMSLRIDDLYHALIETVHHYQYNEIDDSIRLEKEEISIGSLVDYIINLLKGDSELAFQNLLGDNITLKYFITIFLAVLECIHTNKINFTQKELFEDILIYSKT